MTDICTKILAVFKKRNESGLNLDQMCMRRFSVVWHRERASFQTCAYRYGMFVD